VAEPTEIKVGGPLRANDSEALLGAALAGLGIALLPTWLVGEDLQAGRLVAPLAEFEWLIAPGPERALRGPPECLSPQPPRASPAA